MSKKKRVSFGGSSTQQGSLVETLIIDCSMPEPDPQQGQHHFYGTNITLLQQQQTGPGKDGDIFRNDSMYQIPSKPAAKPVTRVTFAEQMLQAHPMITIQPPSPCPSNRSSEVYWETPEPRTQIPRSQSTESRDNPFIPEGDLYHEAESMLKASTIEREKVIIRESPGGTKTTHYVMNESYEGPEPTDNEPSEDNVANPEDIKLKENGNVEETIQPSATKNVEGAPKGAGDQSPSEPKEQKEGEEGETPTDKKKSKDNKCCTIL
ncbi:uncharacterized protein LOC106171840 isoform X2 [Lingula anatina]|uniref:Uncharacterized protein LOC106171840 isoform X2 n=1 Tax=Lingula anatina TaxID=7574 RepID=A0A1S3JBK7_LINAN|nr:uncharacterized protein LOC106171840 isoform X2 [Lingula anatina]|eukprot:XP_013407790.1 uncharacterized protein LOC106171840 isoform X2 [Lingula anatina]